MPFADTLLGREEARLAALRRYQLLDTEPEHEFEEVIHLVQAIFDLPVVAISLVDADRQWFKAITGTPVRELPRSEAFCHYTIQADTPLAIEDATQDPRFADFPMVRADGGYGATWAPPCPRPRGTTSAPFASWAAPLATSRPATARCWAAWPASSSRKWSSGCSPAATR